MIEKKNWRDKKYFIPLSHNGGGMGPLDVIPLFLGAFQGMQIEMKVCGDSHADRAMNRIAADFLTSDCDAMVIIDVDITFTRKDIENLLSNDLPLVYGAYPKKQLDTPPCMCAFEDGVRDVEGSTYLKELRRSGRGFMCVQREVLEAMKEENDGPASRYHNHGRIEWDFFVSGVVAGDKSSMGDECDEDDYPVREWISEDWYFCERARQLGYKTIVDSRITLGHIGQMEYRFGKHQVGAP